MLFDFSETKSENIYKLLTSTIGPRPIAWVTTQDTDGTVNAAPFSFFNAMSGNPPVLAFGIGGRGPGDVKDTGGNIRRTGQYVINLVSYELAEPMNVTAIDFPKGVDELKEAGLTTAPSLHVKPPRIAEAPVSFECERLVIVDVGDRPGGGAGQGAGDLCAGRLRAGQEPLLYRYTEAGPDRTHAWRRLVFAGDGPVRAAAHSGGRMAGPQGEGGGITQAAGVLPVATPAAPYVTVCPCPALGSFHCRFLILTAYGRMAGGPAPNAEPFAADDADLPRIRTKAPDSCKKSPGRGQR